ncbi:hypothetical protein [Halomonas sp. A29]|uniref:hypothetical protein n=1 Tax=Halomonas sp. A29 TaxID=3102786 RepID=UPI00398A777E
MLTETAGRWSERAAQTGSRIAKALERYVGVALRIVGKVLGIATGVAMAIWGGIRGWQEIQEGNGGAGALFLTSGIFTSLAVVAFTKLGTMLFGAAATGVGIVLIVLVIVIAVLIEIFKDNKIQDWLERCHFGKFEAGERYRDPELELRELELALNEMKG